MADTDVRLAMPRPQWRARPPRAASRAFAAGVAAALGAFALGSGAPAAAQPPGAWVLDTFEVVHTEDVRDEVETRRYTVGGSTRDSFSFGGTKVYTGTFPTGRLVATGTLSLELPGTITPGSPFTIGGGATGRVSTPGRTGQTAALLVAFTECYQRSVCPGALKSHYLDDIEGKTVDLNAPLAAQSATLPVDPAEWPVTPMVVWFRGTIGTTTPGDPVWRVYVYAHYRRPETVATPVPSARLALDADALRLPPSGAAPSYADVTATLTDGGGRPLSGEALTFALDPPDMGTLSRATGATDAAGEARVRYQAPRVDALGGRSGVVVVVRSPSRGLEQRLGLSIERHRLRLTVTPDTIPIEPVWRAVKVVAEVTDFDGRPVPGAELQFGVDPPDLGTVIGAAMVNQRARTDGAGRVEGFYEPPSPSELRGRDRATITVANLTHGGDIGAAVTFLGLKILRTWPAPDARDVVLEPGDTVDIEFDRPIDPVSVTVRTVSMTSLWHGDLGAAVESFGPSAKLRVTSDPVPDVGLQIKVEVQGGEDGVRGRDGSLLAGDHVWRFKTLPALQPRLIVSQVVDDPRDALYGVLQLAPKPFVVRVDAGLSADSELDYERVNVRLLIPRRGDDRTLEHTYYPGRWPPAVPESAARTGNTANFVVDGPLGRGGHAIRAELRPAHAVPEQVITPEPVTANVNSWSDPGAARKIGVLAVPLVNDLLPAYDWTLSRGQQEAWLLGLGQPAANLLPLSRLDLRLGYLADTTCHDPDRCHASAPWTHFLRWAQDMGRTGLYTRAAGWRYILAVVPPGYFDRFADHPDVLAHPAAYHDAIQSGVWARTASAPGARDAVSAFPIAIVEAGIAPEALVHALGDIEGLPDSTADRDALRGYDLRGDRAIYADDERALGADRAVMNQSVGFGNTWPAVAEYEAFQARWTQRHCVGAPPCPPTLARAADDRLAPAAAAQAPSRVVAVSGAIRRRAGGAETAAIDPLLTADGAPSLDPAAGGDYSLELRDGAGGLVARQRFSPVFSPTADGALAGFFVALAADPTVQTVTLRRGDNGPVLGQRARSARPPAVRFLRPAPGATLRGDVEVAWAGDDADGDALTYTVLFSGDGGARWEPLVIDSAATAYRLPGALVGNGPSARLRVVASDGFDTAEATVAFALDNPLAVLAVAPADGARAVPPRTLVEARPRDALDAASVGAGTLTLTAVAGAGAAAGAGAVAGTVGYEALDRTVVFTPTRELAPATVYEARLSAAIRTADGRGLPSDHVWTFTTRGRSVFLPWAQRSGNVAARTATPRPTRTPGPPPTPPPPATATPPPAPPTAVPPTAPPTATPDAVGTAVAATLTAIGPVATATARPSATPDAVGTAVAATLTALAPTASAATPSPGPSATAAGGGRVAAGQALTTGADPARMRMAFAPGEAITLWVEVANDGAAPTTATFDFSVSADGSGAQPVLAWRGDLEVPRGTTWFKLERTVPTGAPSGGLTFRAQVTAAGVTTSATSELVLARTLRLVEAFGDPTSGWPSGQDGSGVFGYFEGAYRFVHTQPSVWRWATLPNGPSLSDLALEADVVLPGTAQGWAALVFGLNAAGNDFHIFEIDRAGQYSLYRRAAGQWQTLVPPTSSEHLAVADAPNHLLLVRDAGLTMLYANGQLVSLVTDIAAPAGRVGIYASNGEAGFEARFDNLRGYALR